MPSYVAFLRAINLGATRRFPQDDIRRCVAAAGCSEVATHINTGNVLLTTPLRSRRRVEERLEEAFAADRGFEVPTIAFRLEELAAVAAEAVRLGSEAERGYVTLLKEEAEPAAAAQVEALSADGERAVVSGRAVHLLLSGRGYQAARLSNARIERLLGVATTRDAKVVRALAEKWC